MGDDTEPTREEVVAELVLFIRETVRELGEHRATGFLKKFYGWYLGRGRFPRPFKQELVTLPTLGRGRDAPAGRRTRRSSSCSQRLEAELPDPGGRRAARLDADLDLRRRLTYFGLLRSQTRRSPCRVSSGSTTVIVSECGAIRSARPPVAITGASGRRARP